MRDGNIVQTKDREHHFGEIPKGGPVVEIPSEIKTECEVWVPTKDRIARIARARVH